MATKCVGYQLKQGSFDDEKTGKTIVYDNVVLHLISDDNPEVKGQSVSTLKIKREKVGSIFKGDITLENITTKKEITLCYSIVGSTPVLSAIV